MAIRQYTYPNNEQITALKLNAPYIWIAFAQNDDGDCLINKQYTTDPTQTFLSIERDVLKVVQMDIDATKLYVAYQDETNLGEIFTLSNPLSSFTAIPIPVGVVEYPVDIFVSGTSVYFLTPGIVSGQNAKIIRYNTSGVLQETINLTTVNNAASMVIDALGEIWVVTNESPVILVRVYNSPSWLYTETPIV